MSFGFIVFEIKNHTILSHKSSKILKNHHQKMTQDSDMIKSQHAVAIPLFRRGLWLSALECHAMTSSICRQLICTVVDAWKNAEKFSLVRFSPQQAEQAPHNHITAVHYKMSQTMVTS